MAEPLVVCDFDGTVNKYDVGSKILKTYLPERWEEINSLYVKGKLNNFKIYNEIFLPLMNRKGQQILKDIDNFLLPAKGFKDFYDFCNNRAYRMLILSDGFDFYIKRFLERYNFSVEFIANSILSRNGDGFTLKSSFPNTDCGSCGTCKSLALEKALKVEKHSVYVGDGISDICPSELPDAFFGKKNVLSKIKKLKKERHTSDFYFYDFSHLRKLFEKIGDYKAVIFDLDGTLVDGFDVIYESFNYSLEQLGLEKLPEKKIKTVIGPALSEGFKKLVPEHLVDEGVKLYRAYYKERYLARNQLFNGVRELLKFLKEKGILVGLITNKKAPFAIELINYLKLENYFTFMIGTDDGMLPKPDSMMMNRILEKYDLANSQVIYVGDSEIDGMFSQNSNVDFIAVGMGLGKERKLYKYKPLAFCENVASLMRVISYLIDKKG